MSFISKQIENLNKALGYNVENETIYGCYNDYHFSVIPVNYGSAIVFQLTLTVDNPLSEAIISILKTYKIKPSYELVTVGSTNIYIVKVILNLPIAKAKKKAAFDTIIEKLTQTLKEYNVLDNNKCCLCGAEKEDAEVTYNVYKGLYLATHTSCIETSYEQERVAIEAENANIGRLPLSIILAIVGAFVGLIPAFVVIYIGWLIGLLFALSPICAFVGYKLGKAPLRWYATLIASAASVLATVLIILAIYGLFATAANVSFAELISDPESGFIELMLQAILFDAIGIAIAWSYITKTTKNQVQK